MKAVQKRFTHDFSYRPRLEALESRTVPSFLPGVPYSTGGYPYKPDVADFNLDGKLDVAVPTCLYGQVSVLLGNGDGTLQPQLVFDLNAQCTTSVETADVNNDGIPDIETANIGTPNISVLLGIGDGSFRKPISNTLPQEVSDLVVRDFDNDGVQDAVATDPYQNRVYVALGAGDGTLEHTGSLITTFFPVQITAADFNDDGNFDFATANQQAHSMSVFLGNGDGTFAPRKDFPTGFVYANGISAADFDNDGNSDIVVSNSISNNISVFKGNGDGTFQSPVPYRVRRGPTGSTVADFNLDGFLDLAISCQGLEPQPGAVTVLLNNGTGGFLTNSVHVMPRTAYLISGDLNTDGYADLLATNPEYNRVTVLMNDTVWAPPMPIGGFPSAETSKKSRKGTTEITSDVALLKRNDHEPNHACVVHSLEKTTRPPRKLEVFGNAWTLFEFAIPLHATVACGWDSTLLWSNFL